MISILHKDWVEMNTEPLTVKQLVDIIFQRPERITNGILDKRSIREKLRDKFLVHTERSMNRSSDSNPWESLRDKACMFFEGVAKVAEEHPRSLKKAAYELKALGFSNEKITKLKEIVYQFTLESKTDLDQILMKDYPDSLREFCDDAFLGIALLGGISKRPQWKTREELEQQVDEYDEAKMDTQANKNMMFSPESEALAYQYFMKWAREYVASVLGTAILIPDHPHKNYETTLNASKPGL